MLSNPIFKRDSRGQVRTWQYEVEGDRWRTIAGLQDGEKVESGWTVCIAKSQATPGLQAEFEAKAEERKKLERDYRPTLEEIDRPRLSLVKPMLAEKYEGFPGVCFTQPKLDGIRCIANAAGLWTRQGKPIVACPHVVEALAPLFAAHPDLILDGELYNHALKADFNQISSLVRKLKPSAEDQARCASLIQYHVYDTPSNVGTFAARIATVQALIGRFEHVLQVVPTMVIHAEADLDAVYGSYLEDGYEGQIVRLDGRYEQKRSRLLLKRKEFEDAEFPVVRIEEGEGNWAGYAKKVFVRLPDGRECGGGIAGTQAFTKDLLARREEFVGTEVTMRFLKQLTPDGMLRHAVAKAFHGAEGRA